MGEVSLIKSLVLFALFSIAITAYLVNWGADNDAVVKLSDDPEFSNYNVSQTTKISTFQIDTNSSAASFAASEISEGDQTTRTGGQFKVGVNSMIESLKSTGTIIQQKLFGGSVLFGVIITGLVSLLVYIFFRYQWQTWRGGSAE